VGKLVQVALAGLIAVCAIPTHWLALYTNFIQKHTTTNYAGWLHTEILTQAKNVQVKKTHSDQYARVPKHGRMLFLFDPVKGLVKL
jgi:hypothetical protein